MRSSLVREFVSAFVIAAYSLLPTASFAQVAQIRWDVQLDRAVPHDVQVWQGETVDLMPRLVQGTQPVALTNAPVEFRYREPALATNLYRSVPASVNTNTGALAVRWLPDYDTGAAVYDYQFVAGSNAANPRAFGRITMRPTVGWLGSTGAPAVALFATRADLQAASNGLAAAVQELSGRVDAIPPPPVVSVNGATGAVSVTAASLGALTAEADPVAGPRLALIEAQTNNWRQAWTWGNHAAAGYLAATAWQSWLSTNTYVRAEMDQAALAALAAYAATNRVTILRDADDASVWWVARGGTNLTSYTLTMSWVLRNETLTVIEGGNPPFAARSTPRPDIPYPLPAEGYWALDGEITIGTMDGWISSWLPDTTAWGAVPFSTADHFTLVPITPELIGYIYLDYQTVTNIVGSYNLTTGNVWQAVADVQQTADDALFAADQAETLAVYHAAQDGNPHPGKFAPAAVTNAPEWIVYTNIANAVTVTNQAERPVRIYGTGANTGLVSFAALREPLPLFFEVSNFKALSFSNAYVVGGGSWQTNRVNLFIAFRSHTNVFVTPITTREP